MHYYTSRPPKWWQSYAHTSMIDYLYVDQDTLQILVNLFQAITANINHLVKLH